MACSRTMSGTIWPSRICVCRKMRDHTSVSKNIVQYYKSNRVAVEQTNCCRGHGVMGNNVIMSCTFKVVVVREVLAVASS